MFTTMKNLKKHLLLAINLILVATSFAQTKFYIEGATEAFTGKTYIVTYVLENVDGKNLKLPNAFPGFQIVGGPNQSSNYQWVNGKTTSSKSYSFYLQPIKEGNYILPAATIEVNKKTISTQTINVTIKKGNTTTAQQPTNRQNVPQKNLDDNNWKTEVAENLFVKMHVDNTTPFVGEQINVHLKLYQRINTYGTQVLAMPNFEGFWKHDFEIKDSEWQKEQYNGEWYNTLLINKYALFAQREGSFTISPLELETIVRIQTQGNTGNPIFDRFFGSYENRNYKFNSNSLKITAKALPKQNQPENFSGAVGKFTIHTILDSVNIQTGSAVAVKTSISGTGNLMMINAPDLILSESIDVFDPTEKEYISTKAGTINGTKKYQHNIVPNEPGKFVIEPISFSYFDLESKNYKTLYTDTLKLNVTPSQSYLSEQKIAKKSKKAKEKESLELIPIQTNKDWITQEKTIENTTFWTLYAMPTFLFLALFSYKKKMDNTIIDFVALNRRKANKLALKKLKLAQLYLKQENQKAFYNEVIRSLWNYVSLKLNIEPENLSKENIFEQLVSHNVNEGIAEEYIQLISNCEQAIYTPIKSNQMNEDFEQAKELIIKLEDVLK